MKQPIFIATSLGFIAIASVCYGSAALALWLLAWPWWLQLIILSWLALDYRRVINMHGLRLHKYAVNIICQDCGKWQYRMSSGQQYKGSIIRSRSFCSNLALVLCMQHMYGVRYIFIPRDALSKHNYRFLAFKLNCTSK